MVVALGPGRFYGSSLPRPRFYSDVHLSADGKRVDPPVGVLDPLLAWSREAHWSMGGLSFDRHRLQGRIEGSVKMLRAQEERKEKENKKRGRVEGNVVGVGSVAEAGSGRRKLRKTASKQVVFSDVEDGLLLPVEEQRSVLPEEEQTEVELDSEAGEEEPAKSPTPVPPLAPAGRVTRSGAARRKLLRRTLLDDSDGEGHVPESVESSPVSPTVSEAIPSMGTGERASATSPRLKKRKRARKLGEEFDRLAAADSPAIVPPTTSVLTASIGKRSEKKVPVKDKGETADVSSPATVASRKLGEEFDKLAAIDTTATVSAPLMGVAALARRRLDSKTPSKGMGKTVDVSSPKPSSPKISPGKSSRRTRQSALKEQ